MRHATAPDPCFDAHAAGKQHKHYDHHQQREAKVSRLSSVMISKQLIPARNETTCASKYLCI